MAAKYAIVTIVAVAIFIVAILLLAVYTAEEHSEVSRIQDQQHERGAVGNSTATGRQWRGGRS